MSPVETTKLKPVLIVLSGLPGTGKSSLAREVSLQLGAFWLRIDSIETAIKASGVFQGSVMDSGYRTAYAIAEDNLRLGRTVIGDSVNPLGLTRDAWREAGLRAGARVFEIEIVCSNPDEHRRRVETRGSEISGHVLPTWAAVVAREYHPWDRDHLVIDTAGRDLSASVAEIMAKLEHP